MARRIEFDRDEALTKATQLFWKRGYVHTSVAQLQTAMKIGEGSFYNSFKSKKRLYLECLKHYNRTFMSRRSAALTSERTAKERVVDFFEVVIDDLTSFDASGCLVSNSITMEVLSERNLAKYLFDGFSSFEGLLANIVEEGQSRGEIDPSSEPKVIARVLFTYLHGLNRLSSYQLDGKARRAETRAFLDSVLPAPKEAS